MSIKKPSCVQFRCELHGGTRFYLSRELRKKMRKALKKIRKEEEQQQR